MDRHPLCVTPDRSLLDVVTLMSQRSPDDLLASESSTSISSTAIAKRSSLALVIDDDQLVGIITERDVVRLTAQGVSFAQILVTDVMTRNVTTLHESEIQDAFHVLNLFRRQRIRHVPVVDDQSQVVGVLTQADLHNSLQAADLLKLRQVGEVMSSQVISAPPEATVLQLAEQMKTHRVSCVVIVESESIPQASSSIVRPLGIVTERDVVQFQALELTLNSLDARSVMSTPLVCHQPEDDLWTVHQTMQRMRVRRLVITNESDHLAGIVTQTSILATMNPVEMQNIITILQQQVQHLQDERVQLLQQRTLQLEQDLTLTADRFQAIFNQTYQFIGLLEPDGTLIEANQTALEFGGLQREDVIGRPFWETHWWTIAPQTQEDLRAAIALAAEGEFVRYNVEVWGINNEVITIDFSLRPILDDAGAVKFIIPEGRDVTELKMAHEALKQSEQRYVTLAQELESRVEQRAFEIEQLTELYRLFYQKTPVMLHSLDRQGCIRYVSDYWLTTLGYSRDEVIGRNFNEFLTPESRQYAETVILPKCFQVGTCCDISYQIVKKKGEIIDVLLSANSHREASGERLSLEIMVDVTASNQELFREKELAQVTLQSIADAVITTDAEGYIQYFNPVAEQLTGWQANDAKGLPLTSVFNIVNEITRAPVNNPVERVLREGCISGLANHTVLISKDSTEYSIEDSAAPIRARDGEMIGAVMVFHDVTQSRQLARELSWQASHDSLTGLPNRPYFEQALVNLLQGLHQMEQTDQVHALCYLDLDQFKVVNDTCGHIAGDELLRQIARTLKQQIRSTDILARLGGDEFGILLHHCTLAAATAIAEKLRAAVQSFRFIWHDLSFSLGASLGLVIIDQAIGTFENILSAADAACYVAKDQGRNRVHVYQINDSELLRQRGERQWSVRIRRALEENRFQLYHQAIANTSDSTAAPSHYEVLLRMVDETGEVIPPGAFIPAAERYDLMADIDRWVVQSFFAWWGRSQSDRLSFHQSTATRQSDHSSQERVYFINLSGASVGDTKFLNFLKEQFSQHHTSASMVGFEITETAAIANLEQATHFIDELNQLGCPFALDDFGSGMSSFGYLKNLSVDYLKIDGSFIRDIANDPATHAIVESINRIGHVMGLKTIAESVENSTLRQELVDMQVDYVQGYGVSYPCLLA